jgi:hypothetical protein
MTMRSLSALKRHEIWPAPMMASLMALLLTMTLIGMSNFANSALRVSGTPASLDSSIGSALNRAGIELRDRVRNTAIETEIQEAEVHHPRSRTQTFFAAATQVAATILPIFVETSLVEPAYAKPQTHPSPAGQGHSNSDAKATGHKALQLDSATQKDAKGQSRAQIKEKDKHS